MPLAPEEIDAEERMEAGRQQAAADKAGLKKNQSLKEKPVGQTSETVYPYTYWWVRGYNEFVSEQ